MFGSGSLLVTYGDVWKELKTPSKINPEIRQRLRNGKGRPQPFKPRAFAVQTLNMLGSAAAGVWTRLLLKEPTDDEVHAYPNNFK